MACQDENSVAPPDDQGGPPPIDLSAFTGCWHVTSTADGIRTGPQGCRAALDSVMALLTIVAGDSVFARIDTVTHLTFVEPYRGTGDFAGTDVRGLKGGTVKAVYHHNAGSCQLTTRISGSINAQEEDSQFEAFYTVLIHFEGDDSCATGDCGSYITFHGVRRPDARCEAPR